MMTGSRLRYMPALDGLRAVAIALVVATHAVPSFKFGMLGVDVFFVLSGFLITTLIADQIRDGEFSRRRFYLRRGIRLVPALVVTVVVLTPLGVLVMKGEPTVVAAVAALLYLSPFMPLNIFRDTWTLAIEEWFYLVWPLVLGKFFRDHLTRRQAAALVGALAILMQAAMAFQPGSIAARPSALLAGAALGLWWLDGGRFTKPTTPAVGGLCLLLVAAFAGPVLYGPLPFWFAVSGSVAIVGGLASGASLVVRRWLELRPMVAVGIVSYEWYLLHDAMLRMTGELWGASSAWFVVPGSLLLAFGLHYALMPLQARMRRRLEVRRDLDVADATSAAGA